MKDTRKNSRSSLIRFIGGIAMIVVCLFCFLCAVGALKGVGKAVNKFLVGFFGLAVYGYLLSGIVFGIALITKQEVRMNRGRMFLFYGMITLAILALHIYTSSGVILGSKWGEYLLACYRNTNTAGGMLFGIIAYLPMRYITSVGALSIVCAAFFVLLILALKNTIKKNVVYEAVDRRKPARRTKKSAKSNENYTHRIKPQAYPEITDFSDVNGGYYQVGVEEAPEPREKGGLFRRRRKGTDGYRSLDDSAVLYPNSGVGVEDERVIPAPVPVRPTASGEWFDGSTRITPVSENPSTQAMQNYSARQSEQAADSERYRRAVNERFMARYREISSSGEYEVPVAPAEPEKKPAPNGFSMDEWRKASVQNFFGKEEEEKEVIPPTRVYNLQGDDPINETVRRAEEAVNTGMLGAINKAKYPSRQETPPPTKENDLDYTTTAYTSPQLRAEDTNGSADYRIAEENAPSSSYASDDRMPSEYAENGIGARTSDSVYGNVNVSPITAPNPENVKSIEDVKKESAEQKETEQKQKVSERAKTFAELRREEKKDAPPLKNMTSAPINLDKQDDKQTMFNVDSARFDSRPEGVPRAFVESEHKGEDFITPKTEPKKQDKAEDMFKSETSTADKVKAAKERMMSPEEKTEKARLTATEIVKKSMPKKHSVYTPPPVSLLLPPAPPIESNAELLEKNGETIVSVLKEFEVRDCEVIETRVGPTVTLYKMRVEMKLGKSITSLLSHETDLQFRLAAPSDIHILAPIPGESAVGIEVPNTKTRIIRLSEIVDSPEFNQQKDPVSFAYGQDIYGGNMVIPIKNLPHVLVAGSTGSGKSCCISSLITSMLFKATPDEVRFILIDPKRVEFSVYEGMPHLLFNEILDNAARAMRALTWAVEEMDRRNELLKNARVRNLDEYNSAANLNGMEKMPRIIIIIDEYADLFAVLGKNLETVITRIASVARAAGIHLVVATQRPSVDVISGTIKTNFPCRIAFKVTSLVDSKTVLDTIGAEKLVGKGDSFFKEATSPNLNRCQGAFVSTEEVIELVNYVKEHNECDFREDVQAFVDSEPQPEPSAPTAVERMQKATNDTEAIVIKALEVGVKAASNNYSPLTVSSMQSRLGLGYPKAKKIFDIIMERGYLSPCPSGKNGFYVNLTESDLDALRRALESGDGE